LTDEQDSNGGRSFRVMTAAIFWPIYLPILLRRTAPPNATGTYHSAVASRQRSTDSSELDKTQNDDMAATIAHVEKELDTALNSLDGWSDDVLAGEYGRFSELRSAWHVQANRIRDLDQLLVEPSFGATPMSTPPTVAVTDVEQASERMLQSEQVRQANIVRLREIRRQMHQDLMGTLAWVRELVTMIHLAKYTGAPASRAAELVAQIAAAVEGLSEVSTWQETPFAARSNAAAEVRSTDNAANATVTGLATAADSTSVPA
jgi:hypothetical protein